MTFREETITICYLQVFIFAPVEFQSSFQVLNFVGVSVSRGNLALITRDPFQPNIFFLLSNASSSLSLVDIFLGSKLLIGYLLNQKPKKP